MVVRAEAAPRAHTAASVKQGASGSLEPAARLSTVAPAAKARGGVAAWARAVRVRQWPKNLLLFAAPAAAGVLWHPGVLGRVSLAALAFCALSAGAYLLNDLRDASEDRRHPVKRRRPIAARLIGPRRAFAVAVVAYALGLVVCGALGAVSLLVAASYATLNFAYTAWLRRIAIIDIAAIAAAFVIRAVAGGVAAGVAISPWFLVVISFAALLVAAGKRYADFCDTEARSARAVLAQYNADFLRMVITAALAVAVTAYCLWAFQSVHRAGLGWRELTILPVTFALLRYLLVVTSGGGGSPEDVIVGDRPMQVATLAWLLTFTLGPVT
jgi:decaprenyl-phosphate phosphoribosyltransferase